MQIGPLPMAAPGTVIYNFDFVLQGATSVPPDELVRVHPWGTGVVRQDSIHMLRRRVRAADAGEQQREGAGDRAGPVADLPLPRVLPAAPGPGAALPLQRPARLLRLRPPGQRSPLSAALDLALGCVQSGREPCTAGGLPNYVQTEGSGWTADHVKAPLGSFWHEWQAMCTPFAMLIRTCGRQG